MQKDQSGDVGSQAIKIWKMMTVEPEVPGGSEVAVGKSSEGQAGWRLIRGLGLLAKARLQTPGAC